MTVAEATVERPVRRDSKGLPQWNVQPIDRVEGSTFSHFQAPKPRGPNEQSTPTSTTACEMQSEQSIGNGHQYSLASGVGPSLHAQRPRPGSTENLSRPLVACDLCTIEPVLRVGPLFAWRTNARVFYQVAQTQRTELAVLRGTGSSKTQTSRPLRSKTLIIPKRDH